MYLCQSLKFVLLLFTYVKVIIYLCQRYYLPMSRYYLPMSKFVLLLLLFFFDQSTYVHTKIDATGWVAEKCDCE